MGESWIASAGTWTISGTATTTSSNAALDCQKENPEDSGKLIFTASVSATEYDDEIYIAVGNAKLQVKLNESAICKGRITLTVGGEEKIRGATLLPDTQYTISLCIDGEHVVGTLSRTATNDVILLIDSEAPDDAISIGTGSVSGTASFDDVTLSRHKDDRDVCPECATTSSCIYFSSANIGFCTCDPPEAVDDFVLTGWTCSEDGQAISSAGGPAEGVCTVVHPLGSDKVYASLAFQPTGTQWSVWLQAGTHKIVYEAFIVPFTGTGIGLSSLPYIRDCRTPVEAVGARVMYKVYRDGALSLIGTPSQEIGGGYAIRLCAGSEITAMLPEATSGSDITFGAYVTSGSVTVTNLTLGFHAEDVPGCYSCSRPCTRISDLDEFEQHVRVNLSGFENAFPTSPGYGAICAALNCTDLIIPFLGSSGCAFQWMTEPYVDPLTLPNNRFYLSAEQTTIGGLNGLYVTYAFYRMVQSVWPYWVSLNCGLRLYYPPTTGAVSVLPVPELALINDSSSIVVWYCNAANVAGSRTLPIGSHVGIEMMP